MKRRYKLGCLLAARCCRSWATAFRHGMRIAAGATRQGLMPERSPQGPFVALRRLHCAARSGVAPQNSLRSLRSNSRGESEHEARCARRPRPCAARRSRNRPWRAAPAAKALRRFLPRTRETCLQRRARAGCAAPLRRRASQGVWPRAQRARELTCRRLFERSERSERSEFGDGPRDREAQGSRRRAHGPSPTAEAKRSSLPGRVFAAPTAAPNAVVQRQQRAASCHPNSTRRLMRRGRRPAPWTTDMSRAAGGCGALSSAGA